MNETFTASNLLYKMLFLCNYMPSSKENSWIIEENRTNLPVYYRLLEIEALTKAFGIHKNSFNLNVIEDLDFRTYFTKQIEGKSNFSCLIDGDFLFQYPFLGFMAFQMLI